MVETLRWFRRPKESEEDIERETLAAALEETRFALHRTYLQFNSTGDPDLIEAAVFEIKAQQARHSYLLRRLKDLEARSEAQELKAE